MQSITKYPGGLATTSPFVGPTDHTTGVEVAVSSLTTCEVDIDGRLKPGIPFTIEGKMPSGAPGEYVYGVTVESDRIIPHIAGLSPSPTNTSLAADTRTIPANVATICEVNRDIAEDVLGRHYTDAEVKAFSAPGSKCVLTRTRR